MTYNHQHIYLSSVCVKDVGIDVFLKKKATSFNLGDFRNEYRYVYLHFDRPIRYCMRSEETVILRAQGLSSDTVIYKWAPE
jgi:hypothetical protein